MGLLEDMGAYVDSGSALTLGTDLFLGMLPLEPSSCVALFEHAGPGGIYTLGTMNLPQLERPQLQFIVRNASYSAGRSQSETVYRLLTQIANQVINGNLYLRVEATGVPDVMERDQSNRVLFSCNFDVVRDTP